jgi:HSP20 family protein
MKSVAMYRPVSIERALQDFDRYMESFFGESSLSPAGRVPAVDIREHDDHYTMEVELPGFDEKDVEIQVDGNTLSIASKREETRQEGPENGNFLLRERRMTSFSRSFSLPESADAENISAQFKKGVLNLDIKKRPETKKRVIQIASK